MKAGFFCLMLLSSSMASAGGVGSNCRLEPVVGSVRILSQLPSDVLQFREPLVTGLSLVRSCQLFFLQGSIERILKISPNVRLSNYRVVLVGTSKAIGGPITTAATVDDDGKFQVLIENSAHKDFDLNRGFILMLLSTDKTAGTSFGFNSYSLQFR